MSFLSENATYTQQESENKIEELLNAIGCYPRRQLIGEMLRKVHPPGINNNYNSSEIMKIYCEMARDKDLEQWVNNL